MRRIAPPALRLLIAALVLSGTLGAALPSHAQEGRSAPLPLGQDDEWELVFRDEFDGDELDRDKWVTCYWWDYYGCKNGGTGEIQWYLPENIIVSDGTLKLVAREDWFEASDGNTYEYTSGMITTGNIDDDDDEPPKFAMDNGYVEVRAKVPKGKGLWPAIWMLPTDFTSKPEFDLLEILGHEPTKVYMSVHFLDDDENRAREREIYEGPDFSEDWHTFGFDWHEDTLIWYIDGEERWRYEDAGHISHKPMYLLINLAVGGSWAGDPDDSTPFPSAFEIDYVRIWEHKSH